MGFLTGSLCGAPGKSLCVTTLLGHATLKNRVEDRWRESGQGREQHEGGDRPAYTTSMSRSERSIVWEAVPSRKRVLQRAVYLQGTRGQNWFATSSLMAKGLHYGMLTPPWLGILGTPRRFHGLSCLDAKGDPSPRLEVSACLVGGRRISAGLWVCLSESGHSSGWAWIMSRGFRDRAMWEHLEWHVNGVRYCSLYVTTLTVVFKRVLRTNKRISWK